VAYSLVLHFKEKKMSNFGLTALALAGGALMWVSTASADITVTGGESPSFPPAFTILDSGSSPLVLPETLCCGASNSFEVEGTAIGTSPLPSGDFDTDTVAMNISGPGTLLLWFNETGLTSPTGTVNVTSGLTSNLIEGAISSVTLFTALDPTNGVSPPLGTLLDKTTFTGIGTQSSTTSVATGPGPYSLQEVYEIMATGAGTANLTIDLATTTSSVPEPASLAFVGAAFAGLVLLRQHRKAN
jgi:hypothetical protein